MLVKRRDIPLWWMFYNLHDTICMDDGVMNNLRSPSVAVFKARKINSEPIIRIYAESKNEQSADALAQRIMAEIKQIAGI